MQNCFNPLNLDPAEMLLSSQGCMTSCTKIAIEKPKTYICNTPLLCFINNNHTSGLAKIMFKVRRGFLHAQYFTCLWRTYVKNVYRRSSPEVFSKKGILLQICCIFTEEYPYRSVISVELNSHFCMDVLL